MIISGKELSARLKEEMAAQVAAFPEKYGRVPHLVVILVGEDPGSVSYVTGKAKASEVVGIRNTTIRKPDTISESELLDLIADLNADDSVDGILVQLPLPKHISEDKVIAAIAKEKDVDGFHPINVGRMSIGLPCYVSATPNGILECVCISEPTPITDMFTMLFPQPRMRQKAKLRQSCFGKMIRWYMGTRAI